MTHLDNVYQEIITRVENKLKGQFATKRDEKLLMKVFPQRENEKTFAFMVSK